MTGTRILVVENEPITALDERRILIALGYKVTEIVASGEEAIRSVGENKPELVLMDITLAGGMDGIEAATEINQRFDLPVIFVTARIDHPSLDRAVKSAAFGYVHKPFSKETLSTTIELAIYKHRMEKKLRESEEKISAARDAAVRDSLAKSDFLASMSHELRTPLNAVMGFAEMMRQHIFGPLGDPHYEGYAKDIYNSGAHLLELINDILDISKVEKGKLELHEEDIDVGEVVRSSLDMVRKQAVAGKVELTDGPGENLPLLRADERIVKQILLNFLSNAVKFTPAGGRVTISAGIGGDGGFIFRIADTGIGIAGEDIAKVLSPYAQVDSALARRHKGTGLGVSLAKRLTEAHGGTLEIESEIGKGTTVTVRFPPARTVE